MGDVLILRRVLAATLVAAGLVAVGELPAQACPAASSSLDQQTMSADDVFTGTVDRRRANGQRVEYTVSVDRVYKGRLDTAEATVTTSVRVRACGVPGFRPGDGVVFFTTGEDLRTSARTGTAPATDARVRRVERLLGDGRPATPVEPAEATFTSVAGGTTSLERVAAPGVALVLVGLLGLLAAAVVGRRRA
jgi:hypothetical protein